jgi:hypothetical protein
MACWYAAKYFIDGDTNMQLPNIALQAQSHVIVYFLVLQGGNHFDKRLALASTMRLTMPKRSKVLRASRSIRVTVTTSPGGQLAERMVVMQVGCVTE